MHKCQAQKTHRSQLLYFGCFYNVLIFNTFCGKMLINKFKALNMFIQRLQHKLITQYLRLGFGGKLLKKYYLTRGNQRYFVGNLLILQKSIITIFVLNLQNKIKKIKNCLQRQRVTYLSNTI